ncbi:MAG: hypothetical protein LBU98_01040 [Alistipes sp.]|jgi:hypothetical protein|nr:hypothetical protein [Alistipes sp.]
MNRMIKYLAAALFIGALLAVGCNPTPGGGSDGSFDKSLLYAGTGEWSLTRNFGSGPEELCHKFNANGTGWEKNITLEQLEEQRFTWSLTGSRLTFIHDVEMGGAVPEDCIVVTLTATTLIYTTENGTRVTCTKQK